MKREVKRMKKENNGKEREKKKKRLCLVKKLRKSEKERRIKNLDSRGEKISEERNRK